MSKGKVPNMNNVLPRFSKHSNSNIPNKSNNLKTPNNAKSKLGNALGSHFKKQNNDDSNDNNGRGHFPSFNNSNKPNQNNNAMSDLQRDEQKRRQAKKNAKKDKQDMRKNRSMQHLNDASGAGSLMGGDILNGARDLNRAHKYNKKKRQNKRDAANGVRSNPRNQTSKTQPRKSNTSNYLIREALQHSPQIGGGLAGAWIGAWLAFKLRHLLQMIKALIEKIIALIKHLIQGAVNIAKSFSGIFGFIGKGIGHGVMSLAGGIGHIAATTLGLGAHGAATVSHAALAVMACTAVSASTAGVYTGAQYLQRDQDPICQVDEPKSEGGFGAISGSQGDWTKKGTANYNGAKQFYQVMKSKGANDIQAAGVLGTLAHESGGAFAVPDIAQGFYSWDHGHPTEANSGISSPGVAKKAEASSGGVSKTGASMFQYTPFTKYAPASDKAKWRSYPDLISYWFKKQVPGQGQSLSGLKHCSSIADAVHWTLKVEEGGGSGANNAFSDRLSKAKQAYSLFNGTGGSASDNMADSNDQSASKAESAECNQSQSSSNNSADGTGSIKESMGPSGVTNWPWKGAPSDVKSFVQKDDPDKYNMPWGKKTSNWIGTPGQCVEFTDSMVPAVWSSMHKDTFPGSGDGGQIADDMAKEGHGSTTSTPHAGAAASTGYAPLTGGGWHPGHTFFVVHVLSNGDMLCLEENMVDLGHNGAKSGTHLGKNETWDILGVSHTKINSSNFKFYLPKGSPKWKG